MLLPVGRNSRSNGVIDSVSLSSKWVKDTIMIRIVEFFSRLFTKMTLRDCVRAKAQIQDYVIVCVWWLLLLYSIDFLHFPLLLFLFVIECVCLCACTDVFVPCVRVQMCLCLMAHLWNCVYLCVHSFMWPGYVCMCIFAFVLAFIYVCITVCVRAVCGCKIS